MPKIFQVFDLNLKILKKIDPKELAKINLSQKAQELIQRLKAKGYGVLTGMGNESGLPTSMIVSKELPSQELKSDFHKTLDSLDLHKWFGSGEAYVEK